MTHQNTTSRTPLLPLVTASLLGGVIALGLQQSTSWHKVSYAQDRARRSLSQANSLSDGFKEVAKRVTPSVVSITTIRRGTTRPSLPRGLPPEFGSLFGDMQPRQYEQRGTGSGVIISQAGHVLTNNHVVGDATEVQVRLYDGRTVEAKVVGADPKTDVAVIKIDAKGLQPAPLGDSDSVEVGEWVLAIGSPFRLNHTVTAGIISARGRGDVNVTDYEDFLQTDAAINPGNSGGPLVNLRGEVIAINTAIKSETGGFAGIGFAIPSNLAQMVMEQLLANGEVKRGRLGAHVQDLTAELAASYRYGSNEGALIADVIEEGPAAKAGLQAGDIVSKLNGRAIRSGSQLRNRVAATPPGTRVELEVYRDARRSSIHVTLDSLAQNSGPLGLKESPIPELGLNVSKITRSAAQQLGIQDTRGLLVTSLNPDSNLRSIGIRPGDIIQSVDNAAVTEPSQLAKAMQQANLAEGVRLQIRRDGVSRILLLRIGR